LVKPGCVSRRVVDVEARMARKPPPDLGMLKSAVIVCDDAHLEVSRDIGVGLLQKAEKLLVPVPCLTLGYDLAIGNIESSEQGGGTVSLIVER
jgi:hypothetical protein